MPKDIRRVIELKPLTDSDKLDSIEIKLFSIGNRLKKIEGVIDAINSQSIEIKADLAMIFRYLKDTHPVSTKKKVGRPKKSIAKADKIIEGQKKGVVEWIKKHFGSH